MFASAMKFRNWSKLARLEKNLVEQAERGEIPQPAGLSEEIPFGIKALEEEPAIEGVWNAKTATPLHTPSGSRGSSPRIGTLSRWNQSKTRSSASSISRLDIEEQAQAISQPLPSSRPDPALQPQSSMPHSRRKKANSLTISYTGNVSRARDDTCGFCKTDSSAVDFSGDLDAGPPKLRVQTSPQRNGPLRCRFVIGGRSGVRDPQINRKEENQDTIDRMDAHRRLHSAECGQLVPRMRRHTTDVDVASSDILGSEDIEYVLRTTSWPPTDSSMRLGQTNLQKAERRVSPPAVPQYASIEVQSAPKPCPSAWSSRTRQLMKEKLAENRLNPSMPNSTLPSMTSSSTLATTAAPTEDLSIPNTQARKVNEGFEVLPAGSLEKEPPVKIFGLWPTTLTARASHKKPNKLRKRSRSGSTSSVSSCGSEKAGGKYSRELEMRQTIC